VGKVQVVNDADFKTEVLESELPVIVDMFADWCGPCVRMTPIMEELADEYEGTAKVVKVDVTESSGTATEYRIMSIPTTMIFKGGEIVDQTVGAMGKDQLKAWIDAALGAE